MSESLNRYIEHTLLKHEASPQSLVKLCDEAIKYDFYGVCVNPIYVDFCKSHLSNSNVKVVTVIGFPLGESKTEVKVAEAAAAQADGADEVDMVLAVSKLKCGEYSYVLEDIAAVKRAISIPLKVILEIACLTDDEIVAACKLAEQAGADFVKTSTGFIGGGATVDAVRLMRKTVGSRLGVKASGGIRGREFAQELVAAGASRLGTSSGVDICK